MFSFAAGGDFFPEAWDFLCRCWMLPVSSEPASEIVGRAASGRCCWRDQPPRSTQDVRMPPPLGRSRGDCGTSPSFGARERLNRPRRPPLDSRLLSFSGFVGSRSGGLGRRFVDWVCRASRASRVVVAPGVSAVVSCCVIVAGRDVPRRQVVRAGRDWLKVTGEDGYLADAELDEAVFTVWAVACERLPTQSLGAGVACVVGPDTKTCKTRKHEQ